MIVCVCVCVGGGGQGGGEWEGWGVVEQEWEPAVVSNTPNSPPRSDLFNEFQISSSLMTDST